MTLLRRITLVSALAVAVAVLLASGVTYLLTSNQLHSQIDQQLRGRAVPDARILLIEQQRHRRPEESLLRLSRELFSGHYSSHDGLPSLIVPPSTGGSTKTPNPFGSPRPNQVRGYQQIVQSNGKVMLRSANVTLPVDARTKALAAKGGAAFFTDAWVAGTHMRILSEPLAAGQAIQYAEPLSGVDHLLSNLRLILVLLDLAGIALAALLGRMIAGAALAPIKRLTEATEHVTQTRDLSRRIASASEDEIGRLAISFNAMMSALQDSMAALDASVDAQRQLVADASHELRTPVTSVRTNIELLQETAEMNPATRQRMLADVVEQIEELTRLINDLIDLARGEQPRTEREDVRLDMLVSEAVERAGRYAPDTVFDLDLEACVISGLPARLDRAINNLIDNAIKYGRPGGPVRISLHDGELLVQDNGPGIQQEDLPHIFDRFYRGAQARGLPGSGLGLAIVRQVALQHGGEISVGRPPQQGTIFALRLAGVEALEIPSEAEQLQSRALS
jgi:two-component system sensor histidine kinase MprB